jgi:hypothetical protein
VSLKDELIKEYIRTKNKLNIMGHNTVSVSFDEISKYISQRAMAGFFLSTEEFNALKSFDEICLKKPEYAVTWKVARKLIEKALAEKIMPN